MFVLFFVAFKCQSNDCLTHIFSTYSCSSGICLHCCKIKFIRRIKKRKKCRASLLRYALYNFIIHNFHLLFFSIFVLSLQWILIFVRAKNANQAIKFNFNQIKKVSSIETKIRFSFLLPGVIYELLCRGPHKTNSRVQNYKLIACYPHNFHVFILISHSLQNESHKQKKNT